MKRYNSLQHAATHWKSVVEKGLIKNRGQEKIRMYTKERESTASRCNTLEISGGERVDQK